MNKIRKVFLFIYFVLVIYIFIENGINGTYDQFGFFSKMFSLPYSLVVYHISMLFGGYFIFGVLTGVVFSALLINPVLIRSEFQSQVLGSQKEKLEELRALKKEKDYNGEDINIFDFFKENKINPFAPFVTLMMLPVMILRIRGVAFIPLLSEDVFPDLNFSFIWFSLREYDPYLVIAITVLFLFKGLPFIKGMIKSKDIVDTVEEKVDEGSVLMEHLGRLINGVILFIFSAVVLNPVLGIYVIFNYIANKFVKAKMKKEIGEDYEGLIQKTGL